MPTPERCAMPQVSYVRAPVTTDWQPGEVRTFYLFSQYAQTAASNEMHCIAFRAYNPGLVCLDFEDQSQPGNPYQIALRCVWVACMCVCQSSSARAERGGAASRACCC